MANCGRCGHSKGEHGRRGYGACRVGRYGGLSAAVDALRHCVAVGASAEDRTRSIDNALNTKPCGCAGFRVSPAPVGAPEVK